MCHNALNSAATISGGLQGFYEVIMDNQSKNCSLKCNHKCGESTGNEFW
jgi:hypothetical protein